MNHLVRRSLAAASAAILLGAAAPVFARDPRPIDARVTYRAATDTYCIDLTRVSGPMPGSLVTNVQCKSKADWAADGLTISRS